MGAAHGFTNIPAFTKDDVESMATLMDALNNMVRTLNTKLRDIFEPQIGQGPATTITPTITASGLINDAPVGSGEVFSLATPQAVTWTGLSGNTAPRIIVLINTGANIWTFAHESGSSQAQNRFHMRSGASITVTAGNGLLIHYDAVLQRWIPIVGVV